MKILSVLLFFFKGDDHFYLVGYKRKGLLGKERWLKAPSV